MPRKYRIKIAGLYHIINRGVARRNVFIEQSDYEKFLELLNDLKKTYDITIHTYCLMTNHYHILLETQDENISEAIRKHQVNAIYLYKQFLA